MRVTFNETKVSKSLGESARMAHNLEKTTLVKNELISGERAGRWKPSLHNVAFVPAMALFTLPHQLIFLLHITLLMYFGGVWHVA